MEEKSDSMTSETFERRGRDEADTSMVWRRRMACSCAMGSDGLRERDARRQRRARRYFSVKGC